MSDSSSRLGCFRYGCIGCLSLLAILVILVFVAGALRMLEPETEPTPESRSFERPLPEAPPLVGAPDGATGTAVDRPEIADGVLLPAAAEKRPPTGTLVLDLSLGDFRIVPGPADQPLTVRADYDTSQFELTEAYDELPDGGWTWTVSFGSRRGFLGMLLGGGVEAGQNEIEIVVPRGRPIAVVGEIGIGESEIDLGGLWLERVDLELGTGEHFLEFREPLPFPTEEIELRAGIGSVEVRDLGEASPRRFYLENEIGELVVDLAGHWRRDAEIVVEAGIGEARVDLPRDVRIELARSSVGLGETSIDRDRIAERNAELPDDAPTLVLEVSGGLGEIRIDD